MGNRPFAVAPAPVLAEPGELHLTPSGSRRRPSRTAVRRDSSWPLKTVLEAVSETLWIGLLVLVIGFLVSKGPQINEAINAIGGGGSRPAAGPAPGDTQIRDLQSRIARYEEKLVPLQRGHAQLKQRHADLLKAYAQLRTNNVGQAYSKGVGPSPAGAP